MKENTRLYLLEGDAQHERKNSYVIGLRNVII